MIRYKCWFSLTTIEIVLNTATLDYCNSLFHNTAFKDITNFQCFQNCLARIVVCDKVSEVVQLSFWCPSEALSMVYKDLGTMQVIILLLFLAMKTCTLLCIIWHLYNSNWTTLLSLHLLISKMPWVLKWIHACKARHWISLGRN